jgi:predicted dehydrogenase
MLKLAVIGLDTSHSVVFTEYIQGKDKMLETLQVISCMRFPSAFQSEKDQDTRQVKMEEMGVKVTSSFEEAVKGVDGIMLEINDPALHLEFFEKAAELGLPVFLDKPMADSLQNARRIYDIAKAKNLKVWCSSSLRFTPEIIECASQVKAPKFCNVFGPLGQAASGSSLIWYGIHTFEMLMTLMGGGAKTVLARQDESGVTVVIQYGDGRRGIAECNNRAFIYGGRAQNNELAVPYVTKGSPYPYLIAALEKFFLEGILPVALEETLEIQAMLDAAAKSLETGNEEAVQL